MSLLIYIISSILFSLVGLLAYLAFRWMRPQPQALRAMAWLVIAVSLLLPLSLPLAHQPVTSQVHTDGGGFAVTSSLGVTGQATSIHDFCSCSSPHAGDVIMYQASKAYDFLLTNQSLLLVIVLGLMGMVLLRTGIQTFRLWRLTRRHRAEWIEVGGHRLRMVRGIAHLTAGSLRLGGKYIFWNDALDELPEDERKAVLLHELSHIRQFNTLEKMVLSLLQSIWLLNPALYFFSRELELLSEYTADSYAASSTGNRTAYARLLLQMKTSQQLTPVHFFRSSKIKTRIERILDRQGRPRVHYFPAFLLGLVLLLPGEVVTQTLIEEQLKDIEVYEFLTEKNHATGEREFCKKCAYEAVNHCYFE